MITICKTDPFNIFINLFFSFRSRITYAKSLTIAQSHISLKTWENNKLFSCLIKPLDWTLKTFYVFSITALSVSEEASKTIIKS